MGPKMEGAILAGLFNLTLTPDFRCDDPRCTWNSFTTLAVTSSCQNVTENTKIQCMSVTRGAPPKFWCNYTTPAGHMIYAESGGRLQSGFFDTYFNTTAFQMAPPILPWPAVDKRVINSTILRLAIANMQGDFSMKNPEFMECDIRWCARTLPNLTVENGKLDAGPFEDPELNGTLGEHENIEGWARWHTFNISNEYYPDFAGNRTFRLHSMEQKLSSGISTGFLLQELIVVTTCLC